MFAQADKIKTTPGLPIAQDMPWLAPLAGYSNLPFRLVCRNLGAMVACTEMVSAKGIFYELKAKKRPSLKEVNQGKVKGSWALLAATEDDFPLVVQLFGAEADIMHETMHAVLEFYDGRDIYFDLNMGCSVPKVVKTLCGAAMLRDTTNALKVAEVMLDVAGRGRVGFKLRLGWQQGDSVYLELARDLESIGAGWITLHPRFARQGFGGQANWQAIAELKGSLSIPVIASGDLLSADAGLSCLNETGADGLMFARGAMNNPFIFMEFKAKLSGIQDFSVNPGELVDLIKKHIEYARLYLDDRYALSQMRGFIPRYVHNFKGVRALRQKLSACQNWQELDILLNEFLDHMTLQAGE